MSERLIQLPDKYCKQIGAMCHFDMTTKQLIITVDFESPQFVLWQYFRLTMKDPKKALKQSKIALEEMGLHKT